MPVTTEYVEEIIKKEKPDGLMLGFGGQTALNTGVDLHHKGILKKHGVQVMGTQVDAIIATEDRDIFKQKLQEINISVAGNFCFQSTSPIFGEHQSFYE